MTARERAFKSALAATLRAEFAAAQLTPAHVAPDMGINYPSLRRSLIGERDVTVYELMRIAEKLDIPYTGLIERAEERLARMLREAETVRERTNEEFG